MIGQTLAHYRITAALGAGGMGEVWRATDTKLGRDVALKVLPAEFVDDPQRLDRFEREARAVASLNHPHIVTIFSVEDADGVRFLTMELVEGKTLEGMIPEQGLELETFFAIATPLAEAISAAHDKNVIHRDLKPSNVMVDADGRVKVMDFGLAKLQGTNDPSDSSEMATEALTGVGTIVGTVPYMSPEQIEGKIVDHRTDVFSLGVLLYEMATGRRPFHGDSSPALMSSILKDVPPSVVEIRTDLPRHLARVIGRCLEKDRRDRYQTARDVFNELKALQREASSMGAPQASASLHEEPSERNIRPSSDAAVSTMTRKDEGFWVAVLPFKYSGGDADLTAVAEGLSEDIVTGLSRFSYLRVIARSSTERYLGGAVDVRSVGTELAARYVMEGSIRQAGSTLRISVQLVDTSSGAHIWAETYERPFGTDAIFELQDDLVPRIVSTVADWYGILPHSMSEAVRSKPVDQLTPYEALLRGFGYFERVTPEEHAVARPILERAVEEAPGHAAAWAMLSMLYGEEHRFGFNMEPDPLGRSLQAARRAIETAPSSHASHLALAQAHYFRKDFDAFRNAAERAVALNPMDGATVEYLGHLLAFAGDWERGCELGERARQLNPHHPAWYWALPLLDAYRKGDYLDARALVPKALMPGQYYSHALFAALYGQLGEREAAVEAIRELLALRPDFAQIARDQFEKWYLPQLVEQLIDGLRKAGLEIPPASDSDVSLAGADESPGPASGASRADEGFWIAVLPFKYRGSDPDVETLADGLADEIVSGLSRFSFLRVIASTSTAKYAGKAAEVGSVGRELGARYVIEGSVRQAGPKLRISAQLVDTESGAHLWAETYERAFSPDAVFELQDDLVPRIVSTVGDAHGILPHTMSELLRSKDPDQLTPYEAVLRSFGYGYRRTPEEHAAVRDALERAVEQAPRYADAWAMLALVYVDEQAHGYNRRPDPVGRALQAARRAADAAPSNALAFNALAWAMFFRKEFQAFRTAAEQSIALNPLNSPTLAGLGALTAYSGDWERGCALVERALDLNPRHPGWYWLPLFYDAYRRGDYRGAANVALKLNLPAFFVMHEALAAAYGQLGESDTAGEALREMLRLKPDYTETGRERLEKWFDAAFVEHLTDGLRKAGLEKSGEVAEAAEGSSAAESSGGPSRQASLSSTSSRSLADRGNMAPRAESAETKSIVVLPFANLSSDPDAEYFSDGLTDEIITDLSRVRSLRVISRSSAMRLKGDERGLAEIGRDLDCRYVLEGSVRRAVNNLRITARLVEATDDVQVWADKYAGSLEDVFDIQERVSRSIVDALEIRLTPQEAAQIAERPIDDVRAQESYLRARNEIWSFLPGGLDLAISHLQAALELIGDNALIYQGLGEAYFQYVNIGAAIGREKELIRKAEECVDKIFGLEPESPRGYLVRAQTQMARGDIHGSVRSLRRVLQVYPNEIVALQLYTHAHGWLGGKPDVAGPAAARLVDVDPLNPMSLLVSAMVPLFAGRIQEGVDAARRMFELDPVTPVWRANYVMALSYARQIDEAEALTEEVVAEPDSDVGTWWMGLWRAAWREDRAEVLRLADGPYQQAADWDAEIPWVLASAHAAVGATEEALHWLDKAIDQGMINHPFLAEYDHFLDSVRGDARFGRAMERAKREWERLDEVNP